MKDNIIVFPARRSPVSRFIKLAELFQSEPVSYNHDAIMSRIEELTPSSWKQAFGGNKGEE